jgi:hypothetical protein
MMTRQNIWGLGGGVLLIGLGLLFLIGQFLPGNAMSYLWPFFLIGIGALFFMGMVAGGKSTGALAIPGSILTMLGLIFLVQAIFNIWATWAYAWTLLVVSVGIGLNIFSLWSDIPQLRFVGRVLMALGGVLFLLFGIFFEAIFALSGARSLGGVLWAVLLIAAGLFILFGRGRISRWSGSIEREVHNWSGSSFSEAPDTASTANASAATIPAASAEATAAAMEDASSGAWQVPTGEVNPRFEQQAGTPGEIRRLVFRSVGDMTIVQGENEGLVIEASESIKSRVRSRVEGGVLEIWHDNNWWDWLDFGLWGGGSIHYELTVRSLESMHLKGAGSIRVDRLSGPRVEILHTGLGSLTIGQVETQELSVRMSGLGSLEIKGGQAARQVVEQRGAGSYTSRKLVSQAAVVNLTGLGSASVCAAATLDARVSGLGSIDYYGSPQVSKSVSGLGSINARG